MKANSILRARHRAVAAISFLLTVSLTAAAQEHERTLFDHHVHVLTPTLIAHWRSTGMRFSRNDEQYTNPELVLKNENIRGAFLISMAHLYSMERLREIESLKGNEQKLVSQENDFIARCVAHDPQNLIGFYSVNPLSDYAMDELNRCKGVPGLSGLKLHFPACGVSVADDSHIEKLKTVFTWANDNDVPILLHLFPGAGIKPSLANRFWQQLVKPNKKLELYLAHLGAAGGYNDSSKAVLSGFESLCEDVPSFKESKVFFDLSGAIIVEETDGVQPTSVKNCQALTEQIRRVGIDRFLFASDYPVFSVSDTIAALKGKLQLSEEELARLLKNRSPRFGDKRARDLGILFDGVTGKHNAITDVDGVLVGHTTVISDNKKGSARTGVTAIMPNKNLDRMFAGTFVLNGNGELTGRAFIDEWGYLISPIVLTNTLSVGTVRDAVIKWADQREHIRRSVNLPVVGETWDGFLNDIRGFHVTQEHVFEALDSAKTGPVEEGNVGGGTGMVCHVFKGGIGTASRKLSAEQGGYHIGVLVQANYGSRQALTISGIPVGKQMLNRWPERGKQTAKEHEDGSIIIVIATDAPLLPHQLRRVAKRASLGLAKVGGMGGTESGDMFLAFSTAGLLESKKPGLRAAEFLDESRIDAVFEATIQATEESIVNALIAAKTMTGNSGNMVPELPEGELLKILKHHKRTNSK